MAKIYSMTGFAAGSRELETGSLTLELRAVNHRYLDIQFRQPDEFRTLEPQLRESIAAQLSRGKVECRIGFTAHAADKATVRLNQALLLQLAEWNAAIQAAIPQAGSLSAGDILRFNGMLESAALPPGALHAAALELMQQVLQEFSASREREGEKLKAFILQRAAQIRTLSTAVSARIPAAVKAYEEKLATRLQEVLPSMDNDRIHQEIALFASKIDVDEELSRLQTHLTELERILASGGAAGKRLDFLMQELHREANTLGSKSVDAEVSRASMEMKILIEQMREQIQNIE